MPATTPALGKAKTDENGKVRFVRCELTDGMRADLRNWRDALDGPEPLMKYLDARVVSGHTLSIKGQEVGYMAVLTGVRETSGHVNICLAARGSSPMNALLALQYKDEIILKGSWVVTDWASELDL